MKNLLGIEKTKAKNDSDTNEDFEYARSTVYNMIEKHNEAIDLMMDLAHDSEHPRAFEVLSDMIKRNADMAEQLMTTRQRKQKLEEPSKKETEQQKITNNNLFVGTTTELQRFLKGEKDVTPEDNG